MAERNALLPIGLEFIFPTELVSIFQVCSKCKEIKSKNYLRKSFFFGNLLAFLFLLRSGIGLVSSSSSDCGLIGQGEEEGVLLQIDPAWR